MATIHTQFGDGEVVEVETGRMGKTRYKVAGYGFEMWLDATDPAIHTAGEDVFSYAPQVEMMESAGRHVPGTPSEAPHFGGGHNGNDAWGMGHEAAGWSPPGHVDDDPEFDEYEHEARGDGHHHGSTPDFSDTDHSWDNSTTLPYRWEPKNPVEMYNHEQTISPDHDLGYSPDDRTKSSDSTTGEDRESEHEYPGPAPHLFAAVGNPHHDNRMSYEIAPEHRARPGEPSAQDHVNADALRVQQGIGNDTSNPAHPDHLPPPRVGSWQRPAGLSAKFADVHEAFNPNDPVDLFRHDPASAITRHASFDRDAGLDPAVGEEMDLSPTSKTAILKSAAWRDVRDKAVRIVREGGVHVEAMDSNAIYANVEGDHGTYECMILTGAAYPNGGFSGGKRAIANWKCDCEWGKWAFKRKFTFVGRLCSHGYATYLTQSSHNAKNDPSHGFRRRHKKKSALVDDFKSWCDDENGGHVDLSAADNFLSVQEENLSPEEAKKVYDYADGHPSEHPERDYDQKGYSNDPDDAYKGEGVHQASSEMLRHQPGKVTPHLYVVPDEHYHEFEDLGDDRKTTGPDQIQAGRIAKGDDHGHHPAFAWHTDDEPDFPDEGIVHFSRKAMVHLADEQLLDRLRQLGQEGPADHPHHALEHDREVSDVVDELHNRGYDASPLVAMKRAATWKVADYLDDVNNDLNDHTNQSGPVVSSPGGGGGAPSPGGSPGGHGNPLEEGG